jgi:hypothetical protein
MHRYGIVSKEKQARQVSYEVNSSFILKQFAKTTINLKKMLQMSDSQLSNILDIPE